MAMPQELPASVRERTGKGGARATRREGMVPGIIYGGDEPPLAIKLGSKDIDRRILAGRFLSTVVTLDIAGEKVRVIPRDYQRDPVSDFPLHVDFLRITAGSMLTVEIPVHFINELASPGLKRGGVLNIVRHAIEVICPADAIPTEIVFDLTGLDINDSVHISAVTLPPNVRPTIRERDFTVATIAAPAGIKDEVAEAAETAAAAAESAAAEPVEEGKATDAS